MAVPKKQRFLTPLNRREFFNRSYCEWNIRTNFSFEAVVLEIMVFGIKEENGVAFLISRTDIKKGNNLTTIMIQVSVVCSLNFIFLSPHSVRF